MKSGERPAHVMWFCPQDWISSPLRMELVIERDHLSRLVYMELLSKLHESGGELARTEVAGACGVTAKESEKALSRLIRSGRLVERDGMISNPRVTADLQRNVEFRERQSRNAGERWKKRRDATALPLDATALRSHDLAMPSVPSHPIPSHSVPPPLNRDSLQNSSTEPGGSDAQTALIETSKPKKQRARSWTDDAWDDWAETQGTPEGDARKRIAVRINKALGPLVEKHGWPKVRTAWRVHAQEEGKFASPERFAERPGNWSAAGVAARTRSPTRSPTAAETTIDAMKQILAEEGVKHDRPDEFLRGAIGDGSTVEPTSSR